MSAPPAVTAPSRQAGRGKALALAAKVLVSGALLAWLLSGTDLGALGSVFLRTDPGLTGLAVATYVGAQVTSMARWKVLLAAEGIGVPALTLFGVVLEGMFFNLFLPSLVGGDVVRGYRIYGLAQGRQASLASILVERLAGFAALMCIALGALAIGHEALADGKVKAVVAAMAAAFFVVVGAIFAVPGRAAAAGAAASRWGRALASLGRFHEALRAYRGHAGALAAALLLSFLLQGLGIVAMFLLGRAMALPVAFGAFFLILPVATVVAMLPISISGLGVREGAMVYLLGRLGIPSAEAIGLSLGWFGVFMLISAPGGIVFLAGGAGAGLRQEARGPRQE
jgi:uncharacterized protein (TIRG00374 family)